MTQRGGSKERDRITRANTPRASWIEMLTGYFIYSFFFLLNQSAMRKRARDAQEASEGRAFDRTRSRSSWCDKGKGQGWFCGWLSLLARGVRRERSRCDIIKETRSTRRFFLVNFTNTYYYISLIFSIIISNISWL